MEELTLLEQMDWAQNPLLECAGQSVISEPEFQELANNAALYPEVNLTSEEIFSIFMEQAKRFVACGANLGDGYSVLRKNPKNGWAYLVTLLTE